MNTYCKYYKEKEQVSYDNGVTWIDVVPAEYRKGELIERDSPGCGYIPSSSKLYATYSDSTTYNIECDSSTTLSQTEVRGHSTAYSSMTSAEIGNCVTSIGSESFKNCSGLTSIVIPNSITSIGFQTFFYCINLTNINIPNSVTSIGNHAFNHCESFTSINIPDSVTSIGDYSFYNCSGLTSCTIGSGVTTIGSNAFRYCANLLSITVNATTPPTLGTSAFDSTNNCPIYVPASSVNAYKSATNWSNYASRIQAIPS